MIDINLPPSTQVVQYTVMKRGRGIYQDDDTGLWYYHDNGAVRNRRADRPVQPGRGYNFTGVEYVDVAFNTNGNTEITYEITYKNANFSTRQNLFGPGFDDVAGVDTFNVWVDTVGTRCYVWHGSGTLMEATGIPSLDGDHTFKLVFVIGVSAEMYLDGVLIYDTIIDPVRVDHNEVGLRLGHYTTSFPQSFTGSIYNVKVTTNTGKLLNWDLEESLGLIAYNSSGNGNHGTIELGGSAESSFHITNNLVPSRANKVGYNDIGGVIVPINESNPTQDVLGNTVPSNYQGQVQFPVQIKDSSVGNFDGVLVLTFPDLTGRSIANQEGTVTVEISGNNIQPVSGTGHLYYLEFDNGSKFRFSETSGLNVYDLVNSLNGTWTLNGSTDGTQWAISNSQYPKNLIEGYWISTPDDGIKYPYNVGGNKTFISPKPNSIIPTENTYDRNPFDIYELSQCGIEATEDISYEEITGDKSRFYDNYEDGKVLSMLTYLDISEPHVGSVGNFDGVLYGVLDWVNTENRLIFEIDFVPNGKDYFFLDNRYEVDNSGITFSIQNGGENDNKFRITIGVYNIFSLNQVLQNELNKVIVTFDINETSAISMNLNGVTTNSNLASYIPATYTELYVAATSGNKSYNYQGEIYRLKVTDITTENELINLNFSEESGLTVYNTAKERPVNSDMQWVLNGSTDGTQWALNENKNYHHNLKYGFHDNGTSKIPGDPNNPGFDVLGNAIDNQEQVTKYNIIQNYLRR